LPSHQWIRETAVTTVYVLTAGGGDTYRIERLYLDGEQAYKFAQECNGIALEQQLLGAHVG
jgi:hypothetical protein